MTHPFIGHLTIFDGAKKIELDMEQTYEFNHIIEDLIVSNPQLSFKFKVTSHLPKTYSHYYGWILGMGGEIVGQEHLYHAIYYDEEYEPEMIEQSEELEKAQAEFDEIWENIYQST